MITIDLPAEIERDLDQAAQASGQNKEEWIKAIILDYLEDMTDLREAEAIMHNYASDEDISLETMMKRYGMED